MAQQRFGRPREGARNYRPAPAANLGSRARLVVAGAFFVRHARRIDRILAETGSTLRCNRTGRASDEIIHPSPDDAQLHCQSNLIDNVDGDDPPLGIRLFDRRGR